MSTYLVTGAAGFIGSNVVHALLDRGESVVGLDNYETGRVETIGDVTDHSKFDFVEGDIRDRSVVDDAMEGVDYVLHQASVPSIPRSFEKPVMVTDVNCIGTLNVYLAADEAGVDKVVAASSSSIYGRSEALPKVEDMPVDPMSPYALTKYWQEKLAMQFDVHYDVDTVALRYFNVFGPRQNPEGSYAAVIPKFVNLMLEGEQPVIYGDGEQTRDFTYIDNVVSANLKAAESDCSGEVLNVACNDRISVNDLVDEINEILGTDIDPVYDDPRPGDARHSLASIEKAREEIGYEPLVEFDEGLERTVRYYE